MPFVVFNGFKGMQRDEFLTMPFEGQVSVNSDDISYFFQSTDCTGIVFKIPGRAVLYVQDAFSVVSAKLSAT